MAPGNWYNLPTYMESISAVTLTPSVQLGAMRIENGEEYIYGYNDGGASATVNYLVVPQSGTSGFSFTVTSVTGADLPMGFVKHATIVTAGYGWILTRGYVGILNGMASTALASGAMLAPAANGGVAEHTGAMTAPIIGRVIAATGSAGTAGRAFIRCYGT